MYWFSSDSCFQLLALKIIGDVIIPSIHCNICPNANVTVDINLIHHSPKCNHSDTLESFECCLPNKKVSKHPNRRASKTNLKIIRHGETTTLKLETEQTGQIQLWTYFVQIHPFLVLNNRKTKFQLTNDTDGITDIGLIVEWAMFVWWPNKKIEIKIEQNTNYPITARLQPYPYHCKQLLNFIYNITVDHDCPDKESTIVQYKTRPQTSVTYIPTNQSNPHQQGPNPPKDWPHYAYIILVIGYIVALVVIILECIMCCRMYKRSKMLPWFTVDVKGAVAVNKPTGMSNNERSATLDSNCKKRNENPQSASKTVQTTSNDSKMFMVNLKSTTGSKTSTA